MEVLAEQQEPIGWLLKGVLMVLLAWLREGDHQLAPGTWEFREVIAESC